MTKVFECSRCDQHSLSICEYFRSIVVNALAEKETGWTVPFLAKILLPVSDTSFIISPNSCMDLHK